MRNLLTFALKAAISCILLYFAFAQVNFELIGRQFNHLRYIWLATAIFIFIIQLMLLALCWRIIVEVCNESNAGGVIWILGRDKHRLAAAESGQAKGIL